MSQYRTDEINECVNRIYEAATRNKTEYFRGISVSDEEHLTSLLIQATPSCELPTPSMLDLHSGLPTMICRYVDNSNVSLANDLANYIKSLYMDYFKETIKRLMDEKVNERELVHKKEERK
jgi:hypothetical protein